MVLESLKIFKDEVVTSSHENANRLVGFLERSMKMRLVQEKVVFYFLQKAKFSEIGNRLQV